MDSDSCGYITSSYKLLALLYITFSRCERSCRPGQGLAVAYEVGDLESRYRIRVSINLGLGYYTMKMLFLVVQAHAPY